MELASTQLTFVPCRAAWKPRAQIYFLKPGTLSMSFRCFGPWHRWVNPGEPRDQDRNVEPVGQLLNVAHRASLTGLRHDVSKSRAGQHGVTEIEKIRDVRIARVPQANERVRVEKVR